MKTLRPYNVTYRCYQHISDELASLNFFNLYGREPAELYREGDHVYVGPVVVDVAPVTHQAPAPVAELQPDEQLNLF